MRTSKPLLLSEIQRDTLRSIANRRTSRADTATRSSILLDYEHTKSKTETAKRQHSTWDIVSRWVNRWHREKDTLTDLESAYQRKDIDRAEYRTRLEKLLRDEQRPGAPRTFTEDQKQKILALAAQKPEDAGVPITHWSCTDLARTAVEKGIVDSISRSHTNRFLKCRNAAPTSQ